MRHVVVSPQGGLPHCPLPPPVPAQTSASVLSATPPTAAVACCCRPPAGGATSALHPGKSRSSVSVISERADNPIQAPTVYSAAPGAQLAHPVVSVRQLHDNVLLQLRLCLAPAPLGAGGGPGHAPGPPAAGPRPAGRAGGGRAAGGVRGAPLPRPAPDVPRPRPRPGLHVALCPLQLPPPADHVLPGAPRPAPPEGRAARPPRPRPRPRPAAAVPAGPRGQCRAHRVSSARAPILNQPLLSKVSTLLIFHLHKPNILAEGKIKLMTQQ